MIRIILLILLISKTSFSQTYNLENCNKHVLRYFMIKIYDIYLCPENKHPLKKKDIYQQNFSLIINYDKQFSSEELTNSTIKNISRYYKLSDSEQRDYKETFSSIYPSVKKGDYIEARYDINNHLELYYNKKLVAKITDNKLIIRFLDIWLHKENKYRKMRLNLLKGTYDN
jgi:hypothetical protein